MFHYAKAVVVWATPSRSTLVHTLQQVGSRDAGCALRALSSWGGEHGYSSSSRSVAGHGRHRGHRRCQERRPLAVVIDTRRLLAVGKRHNIDLLEQHSVRTLVLVQVLASVCMCMCTGPLALPMHPATGAGSHRHTPGCVPCPWPALSHLQSPCTQRCEGAAAPAAPPVQEVRCVRSQG
jgi:hypothetical protein